MSHLISLVLLFLATCTYVAIATAISRAASQCTQNSAQKSTKQPPWFNSIIIIRHKLHCVHTLDLLKTG